MEFDSIISIFLVFIFFILPAVLKRIKKKPDAGPERQKKKASIFDRIGEQVQQFVSDLEQQARESKEPGKNQGKIWEKLAEDKEIDARDLKPPTFVNEKRTTSGDREPSLKKISTPGKTRFEKKEKVLAEKPGIYYRPGEYALSSGKKLRQAVVWSEILSKPVALREK